MRHQISQTVEWRRPPYRSRHWLKWMQPRQRLIRATQRSTNSSTIPTTPSILQGLSGIWLLGANTSLSSSTMIHSFMSCPDSAPEIDDNELLRMIAIAEVEVIDFGQGWLAIVRNLIDEADPGTTNKADLGQIRLRWHKRIITYQSRTSYLLR